VRSDCRLDHRLGVLLRVRPPRHELNGRAALPQLGGHLLELAGVPTGQRHLGACLCERLGGHLPERAGRPRDQRRFSGDVEEGGDGAHDGCPGGYGITTIIDAGRFVRFSIDRASFGAR